MSFIRRKNINGIDYLYEVRSIREKQLDGSTKIKQKTIRYIGRAKDNKSDTFRAITESESVEWYTPPEIIKLVKQVLATIHIDPASNAKAQEWIQSKVYYTQQENGLKQEWRGNLWLNPPYGSKNHKTGNQGVTAWCNKAILEYDRGNILEGILLVAGTSEGVRNLRQRFIRCEPRKRIIFISPKQQKIAPPPPPTFYYLGDNHNKFKQIFSTIGDCSKPM